MSGSTRKKIKYRINLTQSSVISLLYADVLIYCRSLSCRMEGNTVYIEVYTPKGRSLVGEVLRPQESK